jgi:ankyrin repeat protein
MLIKAGISADVQKYCGRSVMQQTGTRPLHLTAFGLQGGFADVTRVLLEAGADVNAAERNGRTTLHHVAIRNAYRVLDVLLEFKCHLDAIR